MKDRRIWIVIGSILIIGSSVTHYTSSYIRREAPLSAGFAIAEDKGTFAAAAPELNGSQPLGPQMGEDGTAAEAAPAETAGPESGEAEPESGETAEDIPLAAYAAADGSAAYDPGMAGSEAAGAENADAGGSAAEDAWPETGAVSEAEGLADGGAPSGAVITSAAGEAPEAGTMPAAGSSQGTGTEPGTGSGRRTGAVSGTESARETGAESEAGTARGAGAPLSALPESEDSETSEAPSEQAGQPAAARILAAAPARTETRAASETAASPAGESLAISPLDQPKEKKTRSSDTIDYKKRLEDLSAQIKKLRSGDGSSNAYSVKTSAETELKMWESEMNTIYNALLDSMPEEDAALLAQEQQEWLKSREGTAVGNSGKGGTSVEGIEYMASLVSLTKDRAYELADRYEELNGTTQETETEAPAPSAASKSPAPSAASKSPDLKAPARSQNKPDKKEAQQS